MGLLRTSVASAGGWMLDTLLPPRCAFCGLSSPRAGLCRGCDDDLPRISNACTRCAMPLPAGRALCGRCQRRAPPFVVVKAPLLYSFPVDAALKSLKFHGRLFYVPALTTLLLPSIDSLPADIDAVVAMPMHWRRRALRGFNQAEELAKPVAARLGLPLVNAVRRVRHTPPQSGLAGRERRRNVASAFRAASRIDARHVLIVDDVMTTGETCRQLAQELRRAGANRVSALVVARPG